MPRSIFVLTLFVAGVIAGCQNNTVTDPAVSAPESLSKAAPGQSISGTIKIDGNVGAEKGDVKELMYNITGQVSFRISESIKGIKKSWQVELNTEVELNRLHDGASVKVGDNSVNPVAISDKVGEPLNKRYRLETEDGYTYLCVRFIVTLKDVTVDRMWIEQLPIGR